MTDAVVVPELSFALSATHPDVWSVETDGSVRADAPARTDLYVDPAGADPETAAATLNAPMLLGLPPAGDFQLSALVDVDFRSQYDAGVLMIWSDERNWGKFCFERSPAGSPMVVSVVTRGVSDDANAFVVEDHQIFLRISRIDAVYALHASADGTLWQLVRVFTLGPDTAAHRIGFEAQSPTGDGCSVAFRRIRWTAARLENQRDGS